MTRERCPTCDAPMATEADHDVLRSESDPDAADRGHAQHLAGDVATTTPGLARRRMTDRTIVGSGRARKPLPLGRESVERAILLCEWYGAVTPYRASMSAADRRQSALGTGRPRWRGAAVWLPNEVYQETVEQLRERLRGYP